MATGMTLIAIALTVIGLAMLLGSMTKINKALAVRKWDATSGKIISSKVVNGDPIIEYEYNAYNNVRQGRMVRAVATKYTPSQADELVSVYPAGKELTVYVNPQSPDQAVLETEMGSEGRNAMIGGALLLLSIPVWLVASGVF
jgi:hypothetical protein